MRLGPRSAPHWGFRVWGLGFRVLGFRFIGVLRLVLQCLGLRGRLS